VRKNKMHQQSSKERFQATFRETVPKKKGTEKIGELKTEVKVWGYSVPTPGNVWDVCR